MCACVCENREAAGSAIGVNTEREQVDLVMLVVLIWAVGALSWMIVTLRCRLSRRVWNWTRDGDS